MASDRTLHTVAGRATALVRSGSAGRRGYASRCECAMPTKMKVHDLVQTTNHTMCELKRRCATARLTARAERSCFRMSAPGCFHSTELKTYSRACPVGPRPVISRIVKILRSSQRKGHQPQSPNPPPSREAVTLRSPPATQSGDPSPARHRMNESAAQELDGLQQAVHLCRL